MYKTVAESLRTAAGVMQKGRAIDILTKATPQDLMGLLSELKKPGAMKEAAMKELLLGAIMTLMGAASASEISSDLVKDMAGVNQMVTKKYEPASMVAIGTMKFRGDAKVGQAIQKLRMKMLDAGFQKADVDSMSANYMSMSGALPVK